MRLRSRVAGADFERCPAKVEPRPERRSLGAPPVVLARAIRTHTAQGRSRRLPIELAREAADSGAIRFVPQGGALRHV